MNRVLKQTVLISLTVAICFICGRGQAKIRTVYDQYLPKDAPVQIVGRTLAGRTLDSENRALASSDWLKNISFDVRNMSGKSVSYIEIILIVPKQGRMPGPVAYPVMFGNTNASGREGVLGVGETVTLKVGEKEYSSWENKLREWGVEDFDNVSLQLRAVYFNDGTGWSLGVDVFRDPANPRKWNRAPNVKQGSGSIGLLAEILRPSTC